MASKRELASYASPPLTEVILSVQFEPLPEFNVAVLGQVWAAFRDDFPQVKHHPPVAPEIERVGIVAKAAIEAAFVSEYPAPRLWFLDKDDRELIQVQSDRFIRNWRKMSDGDAYPRYEKHIRPLFVRDYERFLSFLKKEGIGPPIPNQCEVTYLNLIPLVKGPRPFAATKEVLNFWNFDSIGIGGLHFQDAGGTIRYTMEDSEGAFRGRMHIVTGPVVKRADNSPAIMFNLTARGQPKKSDTEGILEFFDLGRMYINGMFQAATTDKMQKEWGKK